jgi:hypothetical protein
MINIVVKKILTATPLQIREALLEHEQLNRFFNAEFLLIKKQNEGEVKGGKGAVRQVNMLGIQFEEQIINADNNHISYQIIGNKPVADHRGEVYFYQRIDASTAMTDVTYNIVCKSPWWIPSIILSYFIEKDIIQALKKLGVSLYVEPL